MASLGDGAKSSAGPSIYHITYSTGFRDKIFSERIENLKNDLRTCMKESAVSRGMPATAALEYFAKRDMTGRPLIEAAEIFQKIAGAYRLRARLEKDSRRRMFFLIYSHALAVTVRERLRKVHGPPNDRESNKVQDCEDANERNNPTPSVDSNPSDGVLLAEKVESFSYKVENREQTARRISEAEDLICSIESDIQKYAGIKNPKSLGNFSDKIYEKVKKMRKERYNYKDNGESTLDVQKTREIMEKTAEEYVSIMKEISDFCVDLLGEIPCEFAHIGMGSLAREDATPYSDFENLILLDEGEHGENVYQYFRWYAVIFQCIVVRFGESPLRSFAITEFNDFNLGREKNWLWDDVINPGIRFDSIHPVAAKVPLGSLETEKEKFDFILKEELKEEHFQVLSYAAGLFLDDSLEQELIKPVSQMASFFLDDVTAGNAETSQQLLDALGKLESMILEQEVSRKPLSLEKIEKVRKIVLEDGFCFDEAGMNTMLEGILEIANSLRHKQLGRKAGWHVREVLVFSRFIAGKKRIHDEFQRLKVKKISLLPKSYNIKKLKDTFKTLRTYFPKIDLAKSGHVSAEQTQDEFALDEKLDPDFKHGSKDIFHRIVCCFLMAVGREYGVYDGSLFDFLEKLHSRGIFSKEAKESLEFLVASIYAWRDATYASLGGQEDYVFGVNESLVTNVLLLRHDTFRPDFQKMCSILVECRDILRRYFTRQDDSISLKDVIAKSNLMSTDHGSVQDACGMFGFNKTDITVCDNTASAFGLFGALYFAVIAKRTAPYFIKQGKVMARTAAASQLPLTGDAHSPRVAILPSDSKGGQKLITLQISSPQGPINIQIPQDLASQNDLTALHIPGAMISSGQSNANDVTPTQPGVIQITPQMLAGNKVVLFRLPQPGTAQTQAEVSTCSAEQLPSKLNVPPETLKKLMEDGKRWPDGYSKNAMFSAMFGQDEMAKLSKNESERNKNFVDKLLNSQMNERLNEEMNKHFSHPEEVPDSGRKNVDPNSEDQGGCQEAQHPQSSSLSNPEIADKSQRERTTKMKMLKIALETAIIDGSLQGMMTSDISDMIRSMVGQESMDTAGPKNPLISFGSKLVLPAISFPSLIDKEKRLLLLSECRVDQIVFEEFLTESENVNRFIIHNAEHSENAMDILFDYARLAIEHDGSHEMANQCRTKFAEIMAKFSNKCFYDEYVFNMMLQGFNQLIAKSGFALEKALNAITLTSDTQ